MCMLELIFTVFQPANLVIYQRTYDYSLQSQEREMLNQNFESYISVSHLLCKKIHLFDEHRI